MHSVILPMCLSNRISAFYIKEVNCADSRRGTHMVYVVDQVRYDDISDDMAIIVPGRQ